MAASEKTVLVIGGPTASGKSALAVSVARERDGTIINGDSLQVYQGLPFLTAQPSAEEKSAAPHKLYQVLMPEDACSAARWRDMALAEIEKTAGLPIIVGGTGFYLKTLIKGISPIPDIAHGLRERISARQKELGNPAFYEELKGKDPAMAEKLHPFNTQRLIRAMEVLEGTGKSLSEWQKIPAVPPPAHLKFIFVTLIPSRETLYTACNNRFEKMLVAGALEEVRQFKNKVESGALAADVPLTKALGYSDLAAYLDGELSLQDAVTAAQTATRHYAKRQVTWFRHQMKADIELSSGNAKEILERI